jgi:hypothetical protein
MKKPFHESIKSFIYGTDNDGLQKLGLARNTYRVISGLYLIKTTKIPEEEISGMMKMLEGIISNNKIFSCEARTFAEKILEEISLERISKK